MKLKLNLDFKIPRNLPINASLLALLLISANPQIALSKNIELKCEKEDVFCTSEFLELGQKNQNVENTVKNLPNHLLRNLTFKRGNNIEKDLVGILGPHGHKAPTSPSGSASPDQPRVFVWDELTGFTASWNSGNPNHSAADRIDLYDFDFVKNEHHIMPWLPGQGILNGDYVDSRGVSCKQCHGAVQRPIFPMYPDWPQFYGEFNDEMAGYKNGELAIRSDLRKMGNQFQPIERSLYVAFLAKEAKSNPRYQPLFTHKNKKDLENKFYPYRPRNTTSPFSDESRSFYFRPNLRLGVLYNRLTALQTFEKIKNSPVFQKFPDIVLYSFLDCNWNFAPPNGPSERKKILEFLLQEVRKMPSLNDFHLRGTFFLPEELSTEEQNIFFKVVENDKTFFYTHPDIGALNYSQIPYENLLRMLKLNIAEMDIRFRHDSSLKVEKGYNVYDPKAFYFTDSAMDIGYIKPQYALNPICDNANKKCLFNYDKTYMQGMRYFNSYFDGSATLNELVSAQILLYLTDSNLSAPPSPDFAEVRSLLKTKIPNPQAYFETLENKYARFTDRLNLDKSFFQKMDKIGPWIQTPFPPDLLNVHNRESFWGGGKTELVRLRHAQWTSLENRIKGVENRNNGKNICWNIYDLMKARYLKTK